MKLKLDLEEMSDEFFEDTRLLGIVAPVNDYQLCWQLNQLFRLNFRMNNEIEIHLTRKDRKYFFPVYQYSEPNNSLSHYLYNNQHDGEFLLPEFKYLDYLWLMKGDYVADQIIADMITSIKTIPAVQLVLELTDEQIRNKSHLIF